MSISTPETTPIRNTLSAVEATKALNLWKGTVYELRRTGRIRAYDLRDGRQLAPEENGAHLPIGYDAEDVARVRQEVDAKTPPPPSRDRWMPRRACRGFTAERTNAVFFPEDNNFAEAKKLCYSCPVRLDCLRWAVQAGCEQGCFAGAGPRRLNLFGTAWRKDRRLPSLCRWCGEPFLPKEDGSPLYCRAACEKNSASAGGIDPKVRTS